MLAYSSAYMQLRSTPAGGTDDRSAQVYHYVLGVVVSRVSVVLGVLDPSCLRHDAIFVQVVVKRLSTLKRMEIPIENVRVSSKSYIIK